MPQMRAVMSGASGKWRPRRSASKKRGGQRRGVRGVVRTEAAVAAAVVGGAQRPAPGLGDGPEAGHPFGDRDAHGPAALALHADAVGRDPGSAALQHRGEHLEQLRLVDRAAAQLEVDSDVCGDRGRAVECGQVGRMGVDHREELPDVGEVAQRLDATAGRARPDRDQRARGGPHLLDPLGVTRGRDRSLDEADVVGALDHRPRGLREVRHLHPLGHCEQLVLAVEQGQLAAVAGRELPDRQRAWGDVRRS
jgi:hypothetical protein